MLALPGVEAGTSYGTAAFRVGKKFFSRLREDGETLVVKVDFVQRDLWMIAEPETFFTTDHYRGYPTVLVRLATVRLDDLRERIVQAWRGLAGKRLLAARDAGDARRADRGTSTSPPSAATKRPRRRARAR